MPLPTPPSLHFQDPTVYIRHARRPPRFGVKINVWSSTPAQCVFRVRRLPSFSTDKVAGFSLWLGVVMVKTVLLGALDFEV